MTTTALEAGVSQEEIPAVYGKIAWMYDAWAALTETRARRRALSLASIRDGESVLEVAVGTGLAFREAVAANPSGMTEGIDLTRPMLARARKKVIGLPGKHRLRVGDAHHLDFADRSFDVVLNSYMFDLLPEASFSVVLGELFRVLRPGGRAVIVNMGRGTKRRHRLYEAVYRMSPRLLGGCRGVELERSIAAAGFTDIAVEHVVEMGFPSEIIAARRP
jgi:ubiquinone/menaquinone biosynthesis C-methylase UbiE